MSLEIEFSPCSPRQWRGYYRRIPGGETALHVARAETVRQRPFVYLRRGPERGRCFAVDGRGARDLADGVTRAKRFLGGVGGGSFLINEHGQVLVPAPDGLGRIALAGTVRGRLVFENPFDSGYPLDLSADVGLEPGDPWDRPYVGMWYNLSRLNRLYYRDQSDHAAMTVTMEDPGGLTRSLRRMRRHGPVRFIVNPHGLVLTKVPSRGSKWEDWPSVYVCRIDTHRWLPKEV